MAAVDRSRWEYFLHSRYRPFSKIPRLPWGLSKWELKGGEIVLLGVLAILNILNYPIALGCMKRKGEDLPEELPELRSPPRIIGYYNNLYFGLLLLPVTRNSIWVHIFGVPFERAIKFHRWLGRLTFFFVTLHFILWIRVWYALNRGIGVMWAEKTHIYGELSWLCLAFMLMFTWEFVRRRVWDVFYWTHHLFIGVVVFGLLHSYLAQYDALPSDGFLLWYMMPGLTLYAYDRLVRLIRQCYPPATVVSLEHQNNVTRLEVFRRGFKFEPGQYAWINIPQVSKLQWHPFSISSAPTERNITFHIKDMGEDTWTHSLALYAQMNPTCDIQVDGPYGHISLPFQKCDSIVVIVGGIGVTPMIPVLHFLKDNLLWKLSNIRKVHFYWTTRDHSLFTMFQDTFSSLNADTSSSSSSSSRGTAGSSEDITGEEEEKFELKFHWTGWTNRRFSDGSVMGGGGEVSLEMSERFTLGGDEDDEEGALAADSGHSSSSSSAVPKTTGRRSDLDVAAPLGTEFPFTVVQEHIQLRKVFDELFSRYSGWAKHIGVLTCGPTTMVEEVSLLCSRHSTPSFLFDLHVDTFEI